MSVTSEFILRCLVIKINVTYERWLRFGVHTFGRMDVWTCGRVDVWMCAVNRSCCIYSCVTLFDCTDKLLTTWLQLYWSGIISPTPVTKHKVLCLWIEGGRETASVTNRHSLETKPPTHSVEL